MSIPVAQTKFSGRYCQLVLGGLRARIKHISFLLHSLEAPHDSESDTAFPEGTQVAAELCHGADLSARQNMKPPYVRTACAPNAKWHSTGPRTATYRMPNNSPVNVQGLNVLDFSTLWGKLVLPASPCRIEKSTRHHVRRSASTKLEKASATLFCTSHTEWRLTLMMRGTLGMAVTSYPAQQTHGKA